MLPAIWRDLLANLAITALAVTVIDYALYLCRNATRLVSSLAIGAVFSLSVCLTICLAFQLINGVHFDFRGPLIVSAGLFGGPIAALVAMATAAFTRIIAGGAGVAAGVGGIVLYGCVGVAAYSFAAGRIGPLHLLLTSVATTLVVPLNYLLLPVGIQNSIPSEAGVPMAGLTFLASVILMFGVYQGKSRRDFITENQAYRAMVEALPDSLNVKDREGRFLIANEATARLIGAPPAQSLIGRSDADFYSAEIADGFRQRELAVLASGEQWSGDQLFRRSDGTEGWMATLKIPSRDSEGNVTGIITHNREITARKRLELELMTAHRRLDDAIANMADGLVLYDPEGILVFCNDLYRRLFPLTADLRQPGTRFSDTIRGGLLRGEYLGPMPKDIEAAVAECVSLLRINHDRVLEVSSGRHLLARTRPVSDGGTLITISDITKRRLLERKLKYQAQRDPLTELANRTLFNTHLKKVLGGDRGAEVALLMIDLDYFKQVNDTYGHAVGDELLLEVSRRIAGTVRREDLTARLGGDEFAVVLSGRPLKEDAPSVARRLVSELAKPFETSVTRLKPSATIGLAFARPREDIEALMLRADKALYVAKGLGRNRWHSDG